MGSINTVLLLINNIFEINGYNLLAVEKHNANMNTAMLTVGKCALGCNGILSCNELSLE